jgi:hypothetical protein
MNDVFVMEIPGAIGGFVLENEPTGVRYNRRDACSTRFELRREVRIDQVNGDVVRPGYCGGEQFDAQKFFGASRT